MAIAIAGVVGPVSHALLLDVLTSRSSAASVHPIAKRVLAGSLKTPISALMDMSGVTAWCSSL